MSRIKSSLLGFIILCTTITAFSQNVTTEPPECKNPSGSISVGGNFKINPDLAACLDYATNKSLVSIASYVAADGGQPTPGTTKFIFNYKSGPPLFPNGPANGSSWDTTYTQPGTYWIMMRGQQMNGKDYIKCKSIEVLQTPKLKLAYDICKPGEVTIKILPAPENQVYNAVSIDWGDGTPPAQHPIPNPIPGTGLSLTHTYTGPIVNPKIQGLHIRDNIRVCFGNPFSIPVTNSNIPKITILEGLKGGSEDKITIKGGNEDSEYNVEMSTGNGAWVSTGQKITAVASSTTTSITITGLTGTNDYCFRLQQTGICSTPIVSDPVCTIKSTYQVLSPKDVKIDWTSKSYNPTSSASIIEYKVISRETPTNFNQNAVNVNVSANPTFTFDVMECSKKYEFWIEGSWGPPANKVRIISPAFTVDPATGGKLNTGLVGVASIENDKVRINMLSTVETNDFKYNIYKAEGNSTDFQKLTTVTTNFYLDPSVELNKTQYCYKFEYVDGCGNTSELSNSFCTIFLTSAQSNTLNWTIFSATGTPNLLQNIQSAEYTIQVIDDDGNVLYLPSVTFNTEIDVQAALDKYLNDPSMNGRVTFRILAIQDAEYILSNGPNPTKFFGYSNTYTFITPALLYVPTAFTPNDDTFNDVFKANGKFISEFNMVIYNRWGAPIFESKNMDIGWDGTDNGTPAPPGNYSYKIFGLDHAGQEFKKVGSVVLLK